MVCLRFMLLAVICVIIISDGVIFAQDTSANGGTVRGQVTDTTPAQHPIAGVEVKIVTAEDGKEFTATTDTNGNYECTGISAGHYLISIFKEGYDERIGKPISVVNGGDHFVSLKMAEKRNSKSSFGPQPTRMNTVIHQRIKSLRQRLSEDVGARYNMDAAAINTLRSSIPESIETALKQDSRNILVFGKASEGSNAALVKILLSHPVCRTAFAKHLSEAQLQDYVTFTAVRQQRDQQAVAHRITVALDKELSLTMEQRENVVQSLLDTTENEAFPISMDILGIGSQEAVHLVHYRLKISLDGILNEAQSKVWQGLVNAEANTERVAIAKLMAHTELLGPLDKRAARHLALAAKGAVQQYFEERDEDREQTLQELKSEFRQRVKAGKMTHEHALGVFEAIKKDLLDEDRVNRQRSESSASSISNHPLYQRAIKDVLSEEAFAQYTAHQAEREALRLQVLRDIAVAGMDTQLLLDDTQRKQLETAASHLAPVPYSGNKPAEFIFFELFRRARNFEILTPWQQREFERVFVPIIWGR